MRRTALCLLMGLCLAGLAFAVSPTDWTVAGQSGTWLPGEPSPVDSSLAPDAYGYRWKQAGEVGGPTFAFKNIQSIGTPVTGLGDDNFQGPFPIGFSFHYYWYDVTQFWVGSNGYLEFGPTFNAASPFPNNIPLTADPNNFLAPYMSDLDMSIAGATCHRWNNADSCVIQWTNVPFWSFGGSHTFEIILSRLDSNITFQYGVLTGSMTTLDMLVGIENVSGTMGLKHSNDVYPTSNNAIKFYHPSNPTVVVHDMEAKASGNINSQGIFLLQGSTLNPTGWIKNSGNAPETGFTVNCSILTAGGSVMYNQSQTISTTIAPNAEQQVNFTPSWTASASGVYFYRLTVTLTGDMNPNNNIKNTELDVIQLPGTMAYDDGTSEQAWSWSGGLGGLANYFVPPSYPVTVDSVRFYVAGAGSSFHARIYDDDGIGGIPGTQLSDAVISPTSIGWWGAATNVSITSGGFYVAWIKTDTTSTPTFGIDNTTTNPFSRRGWEYTGGNTWSGFRQSEGSDIMIRTKIHNPQQQQNLDVNLTPVNPPIVVPANGGNFDFVAAVTDNGPTQVPFYAWARIKNPDQSYTAPVLGPIQINPPVGTQVSRTRTQSIPGTWASGLYTYIGYANLTFSYPAIDSSAFTFTKLADADGGPFVWEAVCSGELFPGEAPSVIAPAAFGLAGAYPNPFNPSTTISFTLPQASRVTLNVYDMSGRLVATLVNGLREAGQHQASFDGSNLSSGIYLYRLTAGANTATGKMVMLK